MCQRRLPGRLHRVSESTSHRVDAAERFCRADRFLDARSRQGLPAEVPQVVNSGDIVDGEAAFVSGGGGIRSLPLGGVPALTSVEIAGSQR